MEIRELTYNITDRIEEVKIRDQKTLEKTYQVWNENITELITATKEDRNIQIDCVRKVDELP